MVNQVIWIGIAIGVFFAGLGIGFAALQSSPTSQMIMTSQQMQQMMNDPQAMQQMQTMMQDPQFRQQMMDMMMQNPEMMQAMMQNQQMMGMMGQGMMGRGMMMGPGMMQGSSSSASQSLPSEIEPQTRTFEIFMDEVEFFAEVESEEGDEEIAFVELHQWNPNIIVVNKGDTVVLEVSNPRKHTHTLTIPDFGVSTDILESRTGTDSIQFVADKSGVFTFYCGLPYNPDIGSCDPDHSMMTGTLIVLE